MLLGIDVGGTFTDAVLVAAGKVVAQAKVPTTHQQLLQGVLAAMDSVLQGMDSIRIKRLALSTTIVTNTLVEGKTDKVGLLLMPGPGMDIAKYLPVEPTIVSGYIDHRGREVTRPQEKEVLEACGQFKECKAIAVSGKFSVRNPSFEALAASWLAKVWPLQISLGSEMSGELNFLRRTNSVYYNCAVWRKFQQFAQAVEQAVQERGIQAPIYILKADGGTMPLSWAKKLPVEAIFTGPAASALGVMAMCCPEKQAVSIDVGGTTTDICLWENGKPLAQPGAKIGDYVTGVRAFNLKSVGLGGDSQVIFDGANIKIGPLRMGPPMAVGGTEPTLSDAMIVAGYADFGDKQKAEAAMRLLAKESMSPKAMARKIVVQAAAVICDEIRAMINEIKMKPVYTVNDIVHGVNFALSEVIGLGGAAGITPLVAQALHINYTVPKMAEVANALGAAVAIPTTEVTVRADTAQGYYSVPEIGLKQPITNRRLSGKDVYEIALRHLQQRAQEYSVEIHTVQTVWEEEFNVVRGFNTVGKILSCQVQIQPGVLTQLGREGYCD